MVTIGELALQVLTWVSMAEDEEKKDLILRYLKAYPYFLKHHLTQGGSVEELADILHHGEIEAITLAQSRPIYVLQVCISLSKTFSDHFSLEGLIAGSEFEEFEEFVIGNHAQNHCLD